MASELRGYALSISELIKVTDPVVLSEVEEMMRDEYRTLNHLSPQKFARCARECFAAYQYLQTPEGRAYENALSAEMTGRAASL